MAQFRSSRGRGPRVHGGWSWRTRRFSTALVAALPVIPGDVVFDPRAGHHRGPRVQPPRFTAPPRTGTGTPPAGFSRRRP